MSVCRKHKQQGRRSCSCRVSSSASYDGYGGPDYTDVAVAVATTFESVQSNDSGPSGGDGGGGGGCGGGSE